MVHPTTATIDTNTAKRSSSSEFDWSASSSRDSLQLTQDSNVLFIIPIYLISSARFYKVTYLSHRTALSCAFRFFFFFNFSLLFRLAALLLNSFLKSFFLINCAVNSEVLLVFPGTFHVDLHQSLFQRLD